MSEPTQPGVPVLDGPYEGAVLDYPEAAPASVLLTGDPLPEPMCARYRYSAKKRGYIFKEYDRIIAQVPRSGDES